MKEIIKPKPNKQMERSPSIQNLTQGLAKFHAMVGRISKDAKNPFFKSNYASLPHIIDEITEPLEKAGLILASFPDGDGMTTILAHAETGEYMLANYTLQSVRQNDPQAYGSAISYFRRYAISSILNLRISDDDAEAAMKYVRQQPQVAAPSKVPPTEAQFAGIVQYLNGTPEQQKTAKEALKKYTLTKDQTDTLDGLL